jgi:hypothetical protein
VGMEAALTAAAVAPARLVVINPAGRQRLRAIADELVSAEEAVDWAAEVAEARGAAEGEPAEEAAVGDAVDGSAQATSNHRNSAGSFKREQASDQNYASQKLRKEA